MLFLDPNSNVTSSTLRLGEWNSDAFVIQKSVSDSQAHLCVSLNVILTQVLRVNLFQRHRYSGSVQKSTVLNLTGDVSLMQEISTKFQLIFSGETKPLW